MCMEYVLSSTFYNFSSLKTASKYHIFRISVNIKCSTVLSRDMQR